MSKKFLLFLVEGLNDQRELNAILHTDYFKDYRDKYDIRFLKNNGDITADKSVTEKNIQGKLNDRLMRFRTCEGPYSNIKVSDIQELVHIVDIDGVFIPRSNIVYSDDTRFWYTDECIETANVDGCFGRNRKKAEILKKLSGINQIGNVPYSVYFVSTNMDHLLFNERNLDEGGKRNRAFDFMRKCENNNKLLNESIFKPGIMSDNTYIESWSDIQVGTNSLKRKTNLNQFFGSNAKNPK